MTPKEKAFHLHFSFYRDVVADHEKAKIAALKAVTEVVANIEPSVSMDVISARMDYWNSVRIEIKKL